MQNNLNVFHKYSVFFLLTVKMIYTIIIYCIIHNNYILLKKKKNLENLKGTYR